jgi:hypothetical protein
MTDGWFFRAAPIFEPEDGTIEPDADYYETKARQCFRRARTLADNREAEALRSRGVALESRARVLRERDR